eukprot:1782705-Prymnesium_polylepis.1
MAASRTIPFHDRVEFPNKWLSGAEHGLIHNGYQGEGVLDLSIEFRKDGKGKKQRIAVRVIPWLAYSCSKGARVSIRSIGSPQGYTGMVDRMIVNYPSPGSSRWVVRLDNKSVDKGEEIVDVKPENVVLCTQTAYAPGTKIHFLHGKVGRNANVVEWLGAQNGSKHKVEMGEFVNEEGLTVPAQNIVTSLNECNHAVQRFDSAKDNEEIRKAICASLRDDN